jgi:hypothetical protein
LSKNGFSLSENHFPVPASVYVKQINFDLRTEVIEV